MELKITRQTFDEQVYLIDSGRGGRFVKAPELKQRLLDLGIGDSTIAAVLDISPNETVRLTVAEKAA